MWAAPETGLGSPCPGETTLNLLLDLPNEGCQVGALAVSAFSFAIVQAVGIDPIGPGDIQVFLTSSDTFGSQVLFLLPPSLTLTGSQLLQFRIGYVIDPPPSIIRDFQLDLLADSPVAPGTATILASLCIGGTLPLDCNGIESSVTVFHLGTPTGIQRTDRVTFDPVAVVGVDLLFTLSANGGTSHIAGAGTAAQIVPEPGAWAMMLAGAGFLAAVRRRNGRRTCCQGQ
jgi:hypothetical protein